MSWIKYLFKYLVRHKWFVLQECWKRGLYWQGVVHDMSKFLPSEFPQYARFFYGKDSKQESRASRYQNINHAHRYFQRAWQRHLMRNGHHWQNWISIQDVGLTVILEMPQRYVVEMVCDWIGAGRAQGYYVPKEPMREVGNWYHKNKDKTVLHPETRKAVVKILGEE